MSCEGEEAVNASQGENSAAGAATVEVFQFSGRYVVDLDLLSKSLQCTDTHCKEPLELRMCSKSVMFGLANYLYITCSAWGQVNNCPTSSRVNGTSGPISVNVKAAVGMVHAGMGPADVNSFLSSLNLPAVHHSGNPKTPRK